MTSITARLSAYPVTVDAVTRQGDTYREAYSLQLDDGTGTRALDLSSVSLSLAISDKPGGHVAVSGGELVNWQSSGIRVTDAVNGRFVVWVTAADTETTLGVGTYLYEVVVSFPADHAALPGVVKTLLVGRFAVVEDAA